MVFSSFEKGKTIPAAELGAKASELHRLREVIGQAKALVLMDLDKTLIREDYLPDDLERFTQLVDQLQGAGVTLGLHSDSPLVSLLQFAEMFQIHGPIIYEMAGIYIPQEKVNIVLNPDIAEFFQNFRIGFYHAAKARFPDLPKTKHHITYTNDKNRERREAVTYPGFHYGLWINPYRQFSFHFWAEGIDATGSPYLNPQFHLEVDKLARECLAIYPAANALPELTYRSNLDDGTSMARPRILSSKTPAVRVLLDMIGSVPGPVYMIVDSHYDYIEDDRVTSLAVGNANAELQNLITSSHLPSATTIDRIAIQPYTRGVIEHLENIARSVGVLY